MSAIIRRGRQPGNSPERVAQSLAELHREMDGIFEVIELQGPVIPRAMGLVNTHGLRAADAIQLATALLSSPPPSADFYLVSADEELNAAAAAEGLSVENPNLQT